MKLETHMKNHEEEADWICHGDQSGEDCSFQSNKKILLENHVKKKGHKSDLLNIG